MLAIVVLQRDTMLKWGLPFSRHFPIVYKIKKKKGTKGNSWEKKPLRKKEVMSTTLYKKYSNQLKCEKSLFQQVISTSRTRRPFTFLPFLLVVYTVKRNYNNHR